jgi:hypothetical protein
VETQPRLTRQIPKLFRATSESGFSGAIYGQELSRDGLELTGNSVGFDWKGATMIAITLLLLISVCLVFGGYEHAKNLQKYNRK